MRLLQTDYCSVRFSKMYTIKFRNVIMGKVAYIGSWYCRVDSVAVYMISLTRLKAFQFHK